MITERKHPVLGLNYIAGQKNIIFENGVVCTPAEFAASEMLSKNEAGAWMQELIGREDRYKFDYQYAKSTGILRHFQKKTQTVPAAVNPEPVEKLQKPKVHRKITPALIILLVMSITGIMSAVMSAYHTTIVNRIFGRPTVIGLVTGTVMVLFSATAFTAARWFWSEGGFARAFSVLFASLGIMVITYSMMSTLIVNYDAWNKTATEERIETASNSEELSAFDTKVKLKNEELDGLKSTEKELLEEAEYWKDKSWKRYDALQEQLTDVRKKITDARLELSSLISERPQVASKAGEEKEDAFMFLSTFIKISPRTLRLFMQAVPAMFFDIIAPFALSCAIYLAEKKKEE